MLPENWNTLTREEKRDFRFQGWLTAPDVEFASPAAREAYQQRTRILRDAIALKRPSRVPVCPWFGVFPATYGGISYEEAMYDTEKLRTAYVKFHRDFGPDSLTSVALVGSGQMLERLDYKLYRWPGHGTPPDTCYQCLEDEYMTADEYDMFIADPSGYFMRRYLPRVCGALQPWSMMAPLTYMVELPFMAMQLVPAGIPPVTQAWQAYLEAAQMAFAWIQQAGAVDAESVATFGIPGLIGGATKAPFDILGDTLRGTRPIMMDMYRRPEKLLAAVERLVPLAIDMGVSTATQGGNPMVFMPLHKGADGFMSDRDFKRFYWPTLKAVILGLIDEGLVPFLFVEGGYNQRLDVITDPDIPAGSSVWMFDQTDMLAVKERFTGWACFGGNVPVSLLKAGTPAQISDSVKELIDSVGQDGGYILSSGAVIDDSSAENVRALIETGREYGVY